MNAIASNVAEFPASANVVLHSGHALIDRAAMTAALGAVKHATEKRSTLPILANVKLIAAGVDMLHVVATDLDCEIMVAVPGAVDASFGMTAPTHMLEKFLTKASKSEFVGFTAPKSTMGTHPQGQPFERIDGAGAVDFEKVAYTVSCLAVADFPTMDAVEFPHSFAMPGAKLRDMLASVKGAVSTEETRYYLNGAYMHALDRGNYTELRMVTTDGHRLYLADCEGPNGVAADMPGTIIPRATLETVLKLWKGKACPAEVVVYVAGSRIRFEFGNVVVTSKVVDGTFPDYQRVIPNGNEIVATFNPGLLAEALESVALVSGAKTRAVKLEIADDACALTVVDHDNGTGRAKIDCGLASAGDDAPSVEIGFNIAYLADVLKELSSDDTITGEFADAGSPTIFRGTREGWLAVLMPMRV